MLYSRITELFSFLADLCSEVLTSLFRQYILLRMVLYGLFDFRGVVHNGGDSTKSFPNEMPK